MEIIDKPCKYTPYKAYKLTEDEQHFLNFEKGVEVLPARYHGTGVSHGKFFFLRKHEVGSPNWKDGGYECSNSLGGVYCFHFDAIILHPRYFRKKRKISIKTNTYVPTGGKRGRPRKDPKDLKNPKVYVPTGGKRGRPRKDPSKLQTPQEYVPTGRKRGRPSKVQ
jgi:hypothetical protein